MSSESVTAIDIKIVVFQNVALCGLMDRYQCFRAVVPKWAEALPGR
jgi:hypothetical protein